MTDELREQIKHSASHCTLDGQLWANPFQDENLFAVVAGMERYIVDQHANWMAESKEEKNKNVAFIIGTTIDTETPDLKGLFFSSKIDVTHNNIFLLGIKKLNNQPFVVLSRFDRYFRLCFDLKKLEEESQPYKERIDPRFKNRQQATTAAIAMEKSAVLTILGIDAIANLAPRKALANQEKQRLEFIKFAAPLSRNHWNLSAEVARRCYSLLLVQKRKIRNEFDDPNNPNLFGDTALVQNALFLRASILSDDYAAKTMLGYTGLSELVCRKSVS